MCAPLNYCRPLFRRYACSAGVFSFALIGNQEDSYAAAGLTLLDDVLPLFMADDFGVSQSKSSNEPGSPLHRICELLLGLLRSPERLPPFAAKAVWATLHCCSFGQCRVDCRALFELAMSHFRAAGPASEWTSISREKRRSGRQPKHNTVEFRKQSNENNK